MHFDLPDSFSFYLLIMWLYEKWSNCQDMFQLTTIMDLKMAANNLKKLQML